MLTGVVSENLEPLLLLTVGRAGGQSQPVEAVVDTGFNGFLTLPPAVIAALRLMWLGRQQGELADGTLKTFDVYVAVVDWGGRPRSVEVEAADAQPLVGMALLRGCDLRVRVEPGGSVAVTQS